MADRPANGAPGPPASSDPRAWFERARQSAKATTADAGKRLLVFFEILVEGIRPDDAMAASAFVRAATGSYEVPSAFKGLEDEVFEFLRRTAQDAGYVDPGEVAHELLLLIIGALVSSICGERAVAPEPGSVVRRFLAEAPRKQ